MRNIVHIGLGGNLGPVLQTFNWALDALLQDATLWAVSAAYRNRPLGSQGWADDWPDFWNAVAVLETSEQPGALLARLRLLEDRAGRQRKAAGTWCSRGLDLDLLMAHRMEQENVLQVDMGHVRMPPSTAWVSASKNLTLPHPGLEQRIFVLRPLADTSPRQIVCAGGQTVEDLLACMADPNEGIFEVVAAQDWCAALAQQMAKPSFKQSSKLQAWDGLVVSDGDTGTSKSPVSSLR